MRRIQLIHWNSAEAKQRAEMLRRAGYQAAHDRIGPGLLRELRENPPLAVVIDLTRLPSQGRDVALAIRQYKATRHVPLLFAEGDPEKVARIRKILPDAVYTAWGRIGGSLRQAIAHPPTNPVKPSSLLAGYSGTPLPKKLGIKTNFVVALVDAPKGFRKTLGDLPGGVQFRDKAGVPCNLTIWFTRSRREFEGRIKRMAVVAAHAPLWIAWPKKTSGLAADLTQQHVREAGLASGLVDYKICAIDATWSGLLFRRRR